ncbi:MAG TPA: 5'-nucleotidase [Bacteroidia bacterium]|nr:5'-nucleotidase [Bacteroidia bacterium]
MKVQIIKKSFLLLVSLSALLACTAKKISKKEDQHYVINTETIDSATYNTIQPYKQKMDLTMNEVIGNAETAFTKDQPEGNLGNFVCDCLFKKCKSYLGSDSVLLNGVILNNGGLRTSVPKGEVTVGRIFELMPFDNELAMVELSGAKTKSMLHFLAEKGGMPVAGIRMEIENSKPKNVLINGVPFDETKHYYFISSDYLTNGGDKMDFFKNPVKITFLKKLIRDAIIEYCKDETKSGRNLKASLDGRISTAK